MEKTIKYLKNAGDKFFYKSPFLFIIPPNIYADKVEGKRDKNSFLKLKKLEKKCSHLRQLLVTYSQQHLSRLQITKHLICRTLAVEKNLIKKKRDSR